MAKRYTILICKGEHVDEDPAREEKSNIKDAGKEEIKFWSSSRGRASSRTRVRM